MAMEVLQEWPVDDRGAASSTPVDVGHADESRANGQQIVAVPECLRSGVGVPI